MPNGDASMRSGFFVFVSMLCVSLLIGCGTCSPAVENSAVYNALLEHLGTKEFSLVLVRTESLTSDDETFQIGVGALKDNEGRQGVLDDEIESLLEHNKKSINLGQLSGWDDRVQFISETSLQEIFSRDKRTSLEEAWRFFYQKHPGVQGFMTFSRPGFSSDNTAALIYFEFSCGSLCGQGSVAYLRKEGNKWNVEFISDGWIS